MLWFSLILLGIFIASLLWFYNPWVRDRQLLQEGWSGMEVQLKRRHDLIPPLVEVKAHLQMARRYYNGCVRNDNNRIEKFPGVLCAGWLSAKPVDYFEVDSATEALSPEHSF
ncbi:LemA family protein [Kiritimatiellota bacterium B12222]|nr:LemA family protein [Kiritimatiellota bacterium B12222]